MKKYAKPTLEIAKITTNEAIASGTPVINSVVNTVEEQQDGVMLTVYDVSYAATSGDIPGVGA